MRFLLVIWLAVGLTPGLLEVAEAMVHAATSGHLAHSVADQGDLGSRGDEHGCGTTQHLCGCCASQAVAPSPLAEIAVSRLVAPAHPVPPVALVSLHAPTPPYRPPIHS